MVEILDASMYSSLIGFAIIVGSLSALAYLLEDRSQAGAVSSPSSEPIPTVPKAPVPETPAPAAADEAAVIAAIAAAVAEYRKANP